MKEKSQIEKKAEEKQITLLSTALSEALRMSKAFHFCFIIGTSTFTAIIQNRLSVVMTT